MDTNAVQRGISYITDTQKKFDCALAQIFTLAAELVETDGVELLLEAVLTTARSSSRVLSVSPAKEEKAERGINVLHMFFVRKLHAFKIMGYTSMRVKDPVK